MVVLGRSGCGAVTATQELKLDQESRSENLRSTMSCIKPAVEGLLNTKLKDDPERLLEEAVRANVRASVNQVQTSSEILERLIQKDGLKIVGAKIFLSNWPGRLLRIYRLTASFIA